MFQPFEWLWRALLDVLVRHLSLIWDYQCFYTTIHIGELQSTTMLCLNRIYLAEKTASQDHDKDLVQGIDLRRW